MTIMNCPKCGAPRGIIGWMCNHWLPDDYEGDGTKRELDKDCKHSVTFEKADIDLLLKLIKHDWKEYQSFNCPCDECGGVISLKFKTINDSQESEGK